MESERSINENRSFTLSRAPAAHTSVGVHDLLVYSTHFLTFDQQFYPQRIAFAG